MLAFQVEDVLGFAAFLVLLAILAAGMRAVRRAAASDRRRQGSLAALADDLHCSFSPEPIPVEVQSFAPFPSFIRGGDQFILNTFQCGLPTRHGTAQVRMGDYRTVENVQHRGRPIEQLREFSYLLIDLPFDARGRLIVRPQPLFQGIASAFGSQDIDFESAAFNRRFLVRASSKHFAFAILHPAMMALLLRTEPFPVLLDGRRCCITDASTRWTAALFRSKLDWTRDFLDAFATHVATP